MIFERSVAVLPVNGRDFQRRLLKNLPSMGDTATGTELLPKSLEIQQDHSSKDSTTALKAMVG